MSLINNMLKDLQKREMRHSDIQPISLINHAKPGKFYYSKQPIFFLSAGIALFVLLSISIFLPKKVVNPVVLPMLNETQIKTPDHINMQNLNWTKPNLIKGISLQVKNNTTEISFFLTHPSLYRLVSQDKDRLTIALDNAQLQSELPPLNYLNTAIQNMRMLKLNNETQFHFIFNPDSTIKYVNMNEDEKNPVLIVGIETPEQEVASAEVHTTKLVKTPAMESLILEQYQTALSLAEKGYYQSAIDRLFSLLKADPEYKDARVSLAALLIDQGQQKKAQAIIDEGLNANSDYVPYVELKARILTSQGKLERALALLLSVAPTMDENPDYHAFIAALYERTNNDLLAVKLYKQLISLNPDNSNWWFGLGVSLDKLNQKKTALNAYTKALTNGHLNPDSIAYLQTRLHALQEVHHEAN